MRFAPLLIGGLLAGLCVLPARTADSAKETKITWEKTVIDTKFTSEGVAIADVNHDGKMDVLTGEVWYEAPNWTPHRIRPGRDDYTDGDRNIYSKSFACWTEDLNGDGWSDLIVIGFPGEPCHWYENPQGKEGMWKEHTIWHSACNETPIYADLFGNGKRVLIMGWQPKGKGNEGQMAYFNPGKDPTELWEMHPISEPSTPAKLGEDGKPIPGTAKEVPGTQRFSHGLGVGDINGDGRLDVICTAGWWEQPGKADGKTPWKFHRAGLGDACANMYAVDLDGDGKADVLSSSAHGYGIWAHLQKSNVYAVDPVFLKKDLFPKLVSQTHALHFVDINGDGLKDIVTGKRKWAHGPNGDADPGALPSLYWFEAKKSTDGIITFEPHLIDDDSGIGTQFTVADFNGDKLLDIIVANKHGVYVFEQRRK
jgi:hypothetical protein